MRIREMEQLEAKKAAVFAVLNRGTRKDEMELAGS